MKKPITLFSLVVLSSILLTTFYSFAEERITLTTYYPAPYGVYREMRVNQMAVGSGYRQTVLSNGVFMVEGPTFLGSDLCIKSRGNVDNCWMTPDDDADIRLRPTNTANATNIVGSNNGNLYLQTQAPSTAVYVKNQDYNDDVRLIVEGNVGIGAISPNSRLVVQGSGASSSTSSLNITNSSGASLLFVRDDGRVGIGRVDPEAKFEVIGDIQATGGIVWSEHGLQTQGDLEVDEGAIIGDNVGIETLNPQIDLAIGDTDTGLQQQGDGELAIYTNNVERVRIDNTGNVGINRINPQAKLDVNGDVKITSALHGTSALFTKGFIDGTVGNWPSDDHTVGTLPANCDEDNTIVFLQGLRDEHCNSWTECDVAYYGMGGLAICWVEGSTVKGSYLGDDTGPQDGVLRCGYLCWK